MAPRRLQLVAARTCHGFHQQHAVRARSQRQKKLAAVPIPVGQRRVVWCDACRAMQLDVA